MKRPSNAMRRLSCVFACALVFLAMSPHRSSADDAAQSAGYAYVPWGVPQFVFENMCTFERPAWAPFAYCLEGEFIASSPYGWRAPTPGQDEADAGLLIIEIDRDLLDSDLRCILRFQDTGSLHLSLLDTNGVAIVEGASNLGAEGTGAVIERDMLVPLAGHPEASVVAVRASGTIVYETLLCKADSFNLLSAGALLDSARAALNEKLAEVSTGTSGGETSSGSTTSAGEDDDAAKERKRERERRGERADTEGVVNLRVFTMME